MIKKSPIKLSVLIIILGVAMYFINTNLNHSSSIVVSPNNTSIVYTNTDYGFDFTLPANWQGYSIITDSWTGYPLTNTPVQKGPKITIRHPKWTDSLPYEDIPILVFTISEWDQYLADNFSVSAAPIRASELARNNKYVFALPPRWDFDYSFGFKEAEDIIAGQPIHAFDVGVSNKMEDKSDVKNATLIIENINQIIINRSLI